MAKRETKEASINAKVPSSSVDGDRQDDEGFLGRWARRKSEARLSGPEQLEEDQPGEQSAATVQTQEPPAFDLKSLPDIDSLGPGSDFSVFMQAGVPKDLRTKALRKLWLAKPELANLDGLLDYGEDLTGSFKTVEHLKTAYQVGKGFLKDNDTADPEREDLAGDNDRDLSTQEAAATADDGPDDEPLKESLEIDEADPKCGPNNAF